MLWIHRCDLFSVHIEEGRIKCIDVIGKEMGALWRKDTGLFWVIVTVRSLFETILGNRRKGRFCLGEEVIKSLPTGTWCPVGEANYGYRRMC